MSIISHIPTYRYRKHAVEKFRFEETLDNIQIETYGDNIFMFVSAIL